MKKFELSKKTLIGSALLLVSNAGWGAIRQQRPSSDQQAGTRDSSDEALVNQNKSMISDITKQLEELKAGLKKRTDEVTALKAKHTEDTKAFIKDNHGTLNFIYSNVACKVMLLEHQISAMKSEWDVKEHGLRTELNTKWKEIELNMLKKWQR
jgi:hypothetical protein